MQDSPRDRHSATSSSQSLSSAWNNAAEQVVLDSALAALRADLARLNDPYLGAVGLDFINRLSRIGCRHIPTADGSCMAAYQSFIYPADPASNGFNNRIAYGPKARDNKNLLFSAHIHEGMHALQKASAPALHASPYNPMTRIILCPRDWITAQERCEQDAYVKQAWLNSLMAVHDATLYKTSRTDPMSVSHFNSLRLTYGNLHTAMAHAAKTVLDRNFFAGPLPAGQPPTSFADHYHALSINNYAQIIASRIRNDGENIIFVRLDPDDILDIGHGFGPNPFTRPGAMKCAQDFARPSKLSFDNKASLRDLNMDLGIVDDRSLPTLREALVTIGITRAEFLARAYNGYIEPRLTPPPIIQPLTKSPAP